MQQHPACRKPSAVDVETTRLVTNTGRKADIRCKWMFKRENCSMCVMQYGVDEQSRVFTLCLAPYILVGLHASHVTTMNARRPKCDPDPSSGRETQSMAVPH